MATPTRTWRFRHFRPPTFGPPFRRWTQAETPTERGFGFRVSGYFRVPVRTLALLGKEGPTLKVTFDPMRQSPTVTELVAPSATMFELLEGFQSVVGLGCEHASGMCPEQVCGSLIKRAHINVPNPACTHRTLAPLRRIPTSTHQPSTHLARTIVPARQAHVSCSYGAAQTATS